MKTRQNYMLIQIDKEPQSSITFLERYVNDTVLLRLKIPQILRLPD